MMMPSEWMLRDYTMQISEPSQEVEEDVSIDEEDED